MAALRFLVFAFTMSEEKKSHMCKRDRMHFVQCYLSRIHHKHSCRLSYACTTRWQALVGRAAHRLQTIHRIPACKRIVFGVVC